MSFPIGLLVMSWSCLAAKHLLVKLPCTDSVLEPVPGLMDFLAWIKERGLKKVAVTNAPKENARVMLEASWPWVRRENHEPSYV